MGADTFTTLGSTELYDSQTNRWSEGPDLQEARQGHAAVLLDDGAVLLSGGSRERHGLVSSTERYQANTLKPGPALLSPRAGHSSIAVGASVALILGGRALGPNRKAALTEVVERCDGLGCGAVSTLQEARQRHAALYWSGAPWVVGGATVGGLTNYIEKGASDGGITLAPTHLPWPLAGHTVTAMRGSLLVIGGESPNALDGTWVLQLRPADAQWCTAGALTTARQGHTATLLHAGQVLIVGGTSGGLAEPTAERWSPASGSCKSPVP